jgi:hypothetical protein
MTIMKVSTVCAFAIALLLSGSAAWGQAGFGSETDTTETETQGKSGKVNTNAKLAAQSCPLASTHQRTASGKAPLPPRPLRLER